jgi:hypothetical protein
MKVNYLVGLLLCGLSLAGCSISVSNGTASPYENCSAVEVCTGGTACLDSTLPAGYAGYFCTTTCQASTDCGQDLTNYDAICVNSQCYIQCPTGGITCPYGTSCFTFDSNVGPVSLCTP